MKNASTLLTEEQFWQIIEASKLGEDLHTQLQSLTKDEIFGYRYWWEFFCRKSYNQALWAAAYTVMGGCSDDGFDYFRFWLITRGKAVFMAALKDADSLCDEFDNTDYPELEEADYAVMDVLEKKYGEDFYAAEQDYDLGDKNLPAINFEWQEDDESSIENICPKTFKKWWNNDKF